jgi:hypothetical protein
VPDCALNWQIKNHVRDAIEKIASCSVCHSYSLGAPHGVALTSMALIMPAPIVLATMGLMRLLMLKAALVVDEFIGSGGRLWQSPG